MFVASKTLKSQTKSLKYRRRKQNCAGGKKFTEVRKSVRAKIWEEDIISVIMHLKKKDDLWRINLILIFMYFQVVN